MRTLVRHEVIVASGLGPGVDSAAHRQAIALGGHAVAALRTPVNRVDLKEHADLRGFWERDDARRVPPDCVERLGSILTALADAGSAVDLAGLPGIHRLRGKLAGCRATRVN